MSGIRYLKTLSCFYEVGLSALVYKFTLSGLVRVQITNEGIQIRIGREIKRWVFTFFARETSKRREKREPKFDALWSISSRVTQEYQNRPTNIPCYTWDLGQLFTFL